MFLWQKIVFFLWSRATFCNVLMASSETVRTICAALWPQCTTHEESDLNSAFSRKYAANVEPSLAAYLTYAPDQLFKTFVTTAISAGPPTLYNKVPLAYIQAQQLSFEYARRVLQERPDPPRVIVSSSRAQFKTKSRIHTTATDAAVSHPGA